MKKPITLVLALLTFASVAQYNNTYDVNANSDKLTPSFVITNKKAESITVSYASDAGSPTQNYFILTKHDAFGGVIYNSRLDPYFGPNDGLTNVEALIQTDDEGVLIAGYHYDDAHLIEQPFLVKVDVNGNFLWSKIYYVNKLPIVNSRLNKISLCRVANDPDENYFIVGAADSDVNSGKDVATNVIKVDANGKMIFSYKYYDANPSFAVTREYPGDMEFSPSDKMFMITGYREDATSTVKRRLMYYFGIDNLGNVITKFLTLESKSIPMDQDMVYDPNKKVFATVFTHAKDGYVPGTSSVIGFITINANLTLANPEYLWHKEGIDHNGRSISLCKNGDYLLCAGIYDNSIPAHNPGFLRIDAGGTPVSALFRYDLKDDVYFGHHATTYNPITGAEEHVLVNEQKADLRVIRTDDNGIVCGVAKFEPFAQKYDPKQSTYKYEPKKQGDYKDYKVYQKWIDVNYRKCDGDGTSYRTMGVAQTAANAESSMLLYPTVVSSANAYLTVENNSGSIGKMEMRSISGQLIFADNQIAEGKSEVKLNANGNLSVGIYLVKVYSADGKLTHTSKIVITE